MTTTRRKPTTTEQGLGWRHRQARESLLRRHRDGDICEWVLCGRPMYKDRTRNYDYDPQSTSPISGVLQADHSQTTRAEAIRRGIPIPLPDRLLHAECNRQRGDGGNDHLAAGSRRGNRELDTNRLAMAWPW